MRFGGDPWILGLAVLQGAALAVLLARLLPGVRRVPPVVPRPEGLPGTTVSVILPTLNEAERIEPCLRGLARQGTPLTEIIVVDSGSTDATHGLVQAAMAVDARIRLVSDPPLPEGWIGKVWALQHGLSFATGEWVLGVDADTEANAGMVAGAVFAAQQHGLDLVSFAPRFDGQVAAERFLQPALLVTLVYRLGAPGPHPPADRLLANGQCFLVRRSVLESGGGYAPSRASFADDVTLARYYARRGVPCGFLDGTGLYRVRAYRSAAEMWREWGRSVDLSDTVGSIRRWLDLTFLALAQALPVPLLLALAVLRPPDVGQLVTVNGLLLAVRLGLLAALSGSYARRGLPYWLSWLADPAAVYRIFLSVLRRPTRWRGREYMAAG